MFVRFKFHNLSVRVSNGKLVSQFAILYFWPSFCPKFRPFCIFKSSYDPPMPYKIHFWYCFVCTTIFSVHLWTYSVSDGKLASKSTVLYPWPEFGWSKELSKLQKGPKMKKRHKKCLNSCSKVHLPKTQIIKIPKAYIYLVLYLYFYNNLYFHHCLALVWSPKCWKCRKRSPGHFRLPPDQKSIFSKMFFF